MQSPSLVAAASAGGAGAQLPSRGLRVGRGAAPALGTRTRCARPAAVPTSARSRGGALATPRSPRRTRAARALAAPPRSEPLRHLPLRCPPRPRLPHAAAGRPAAHSPSFTVRLRCLPDPTSASLTARVRVPSRPGLLPHSPMHSPAELTEGGVTKQAGATRGRSVALGQSRTPSQTAFCDGQGPWALGLSSFLLKYNHKCPALSF